MRRRHAQRLCAAMWLSPSEIYCSTCSIFLPDHRACGEVWEGQPLSRKTQHELCSLCWGAPACEASGRAPDPWSSLGIAVLQLIAPRKKLPSFNSCFNLTCQVIAALCFPSQPSLGICKKVLQRSASLHRQPTMLQNFTHAWLIVFVSLGLKLWKDGFSLPSCLGTTEN